MSKVWDTLQALNDIQLAIIILLMRAIYDSLPFQLRPLVRPKQQSVLSHKQYIKWPKYMLSFSGKNN